jgi:peroxiredoxin
MKRRYSIFSIVIASVVVFNSCKEDASISEVEKVTNDFKTWWTYHNEHIDFESDFTAYDYNANEITKREFLKKLSSESVIAFKTAGLDTTSEYTLFKIDTTASNEKRSIISVSNNKSLEAYYYLSYQGKPFPNFNFVDLDNQIHTNESIKNKVVILKTWFIACKPCIAEIPELNQIVEKHKNNENILFISLATDSRESLQEFLLKKPFNYKVIPEQKHFITETLKLNTFPTHLIIDKDGIIQKVGSIKQVYRFIEENYPSKLMDKSSPPPPM